MACPASPRSLWDKYLVPPEELQFAEYVFRLSIFNPLPKGARRHRHKWFSDSDRETLWVIISALANTCGGVIDIRTLSGDPAEAFDFDDLRHELSSNPYHDFLYRDCLTVRKEKVGTLFVVRKSDVFITTNSHMYTRGLGMSSSVVGCHQLSAIVNQIGLTGNQKLTCLSGQLLVYKGICTLTEIDNVDYLQISTPSVRKLVERITDQRCERRLFSMPNNPNGGSFIIGVAEDKQSWNLVFLGVELDESDKTYILSTLSRFMQIDVNGVPRVWGNLPHTDIKEGTHWFCWFIPLHIPPHICDNIPCSTCPRKKGRYLIHLYFPHCPGGVFLRKPEAFIMKQDGKIDEVEFSEWKEIHKVTFLESTKIWNLLSPTSYVSRSSPNTETKAKKPTLDMATCADNITLKFSAHSSKSRRHMAIHMTNEPTSECARPEKFDVFQMSRPINYTSQSSDIEKVLCDKSLLQAIDKEVGNTEAFGVAADSLFSCIKLSPSRQEHSSITDRPPHHLMDVLVVNKLASIMLFVICCMFGSLDDQRIQRAYTVTLGRVLKMQITNKSKRDDIVVQCQILSLNGPGPTLTSLELFPVTSTSHTNDICRALSKILTEIPTRFSDKIARGASLEKSAKDYDKIKDFLMPFNFIEGPPGSGKTLLAQIICKEHRVGQTVYIAKSKQLTELFNCKFEIKACRVETNEELLSHIQQLPDDVQNIVIDDAQNMHAKRDIIKEILDYCQEKQKTLFVLEDCRYQNFLSKPNQPSFAEVYSSHKKECKYDDAFHSTLSSIKRNSGMVGSYMESLLQDIAPTNRAHCESGLSGDDVIVKHIPNFRHQNNNGLVAHVKEILSHQAVGYRDKYYSIQDVAILMDHTDQDELKKEVKSLKKVFESTWPESRVQSADEYPVLGVVIDSLDNFCGLEARVVVFVLPNEPTDDVRSISNPKYTLAIASRGIDRVDFVQEANFTVEQLKHLKFDNIPPDLLNDAYPSEECLVVSEQSTSTAQQIPPEPTAVLSLDVTPVDLDDPVVEDLLKDKTGVYNMSQNPEAEQLSSITSTFAKVCHGKEQNLIQRTFFITSSSLALNLSYMRIKRHKR